MDTFFAESNDMVSLFFYRDLRISFCQTSLHLCLILAFAFVGLKGSRSSAQTFENFQIVQANSSPEKARVVLIGDIHVDGQHDIEQAIPIIKRLGDPKRSVILFEGGDMGELRASVFAHDARFKALKSDHPYGYWDNIQMVKFSDLLLSEWFKEISNLIDDELGKRPIGFDIKASVIKTAAYSVASAKIMIGERNKSLIKSIRRVGTNEKIFLIAGNAHILDETLLEYLKSSGFNYVVLARDVDGSKEKLAKNSASLELLYGIAAKNGISRDVFKDEIEKTVHSLTLQLYQGLNEEPWPSLNIGNYPQLKSCSKILARLHGFANLFSSGVAR